MTYEDETEMFVADYGGNLVSDFFNKINYFTFYVIEQIYLEEKVHFFG